MTWVLVFFGAALLIALTPGANNLLGLHHGISHGLGPALAGLAGRLAAFVIMIAGVVAGLAQVLAASELAFTVLKWLGVGYLVWIGSRILIRSWRGEAVEPIAGAPGIRRPRALMRKEFLVAITNPKAVLIFTAVLPQFVDPDRGTVAGQLAVLGAVYLVAELLAGSVFIGAGAVVRSAALTARARRNIDRGTGAVLLGMAGALAVSST